MFIYVYNCFVYIFALLRKKLHHVHNCRLITKSSIVIIIIVVIVAIIVVVVVVVVVVLLIIKFLQTIALRV